MMNTRMKLLGVIFGALWCGLLIYVMSSLNWRPGGDVNLRSVGKQHKVFDTLNNNADKILGSLVFDRGGHIEGLATVAEGKVTVSSSLKNESISGGELLPNLLVKQTYTKPLMAAMKKHTMEDKEDEVKIVISGNSETIMGVVTAINSIVKNTRAALHFFIALPGDLIPHYLEWIDKSKLKGLHQTVKSHPSYIPSGKPHYVKIYISSIFPQLQGRIIYLDSDVLVQGNILELYKVKIKGGHYGAFPHDCSSVSKRFLASRPRYSTHVRLDHEALRDKKIRPGACTFNTDVFVADLNQWKKFDVSNQLQNWLNKTIKEKIIGVDPEVDETEVAVLVVMYQRTSSIPQMWHVSQLGSRTTSTYSNEVLNKAKLLHWSGHYKPWTRIAAASEIWQKYYIQDPNLKYKLMRRNLT